MEEKKELSILFDNVEDNLQQLKHEIQDEQVLSNYNDTNTSITGNETQQNISDINSTQTINNTIQNPISSHLEEKEDMEFEPISSHNTEDIIT